MTPAEAREKAGAVLRSLFKDEETSVEDGLYVLAVVSASALLQVDDHKRECALELWVDMLGRIMRTGAKAPVLQ